MQGNDAQRQTQHIEHLTDDCLEVIVVRGQFLCFQLIATSLHESTLGESPAGSRDSNHCRKACVIHLDQIGGESNRSQMLLMPTNQAINDKSNGSK